MNWTAARQRTITWNDIRSIEPKRVQFLLRSVCDVLQSPTNLAVQGLSDESNCKLCGKPANLENILSSCSVASPDTFESLREKTAYRATRQIGKRGIAMVVEKKTGTVGIIEREVCGTGQMDGSGLVADYLSRSLWTAPNNCRIHYKFQHKYTQTY